MIEIISIGSKLLSNLADISILLYNFGKINLLLLINPQIYKLI
jgi:hypothetical protein